MHNIFKHASGKKERNYEYYLLQSLAFSENIEYLVIIKRYMCNKF